jgi:hypothetical protein
MVIPAASGESAAAPAVADFRKLRRVILECDPKHTPFTINLK